MATRRQPEKHEQQHIVTLLRSIGADVYVLGTRRAQRCWKCGAVSRDQGTRQTPGISDIYAFLPAPRLVVGGVPGAAWIEVKAASGRMSPDQVAFKALCFRAGVPHIVGGLDHVIAFLVTGGWLDPKNLPHYRQPDVVSAAARAATKGPMATTSRPAVTDGQ